MCLFSFSDLFVGGDHGPAGDGDGVHPVHLPLGAGTLPLLLLLHQGNVERRRQAIQTPTTPRDHMTRDPHHWWGVRLR